MSESIAWRRESCCPTCPSFLLDIFECFSLTEKNFRGPIDTPMASSKEAKDGINAMMPYIAMKRVGKASEVAELIAVRFHPMQNSSGARSSLESSLLPCHVGGSILLELSR